MVGRKVFVCAAAEDAGYAQEVVTALNAWEAPHTDLGRAPNPVSSLPHAIEEAIHNCEVFLRLCTTHTHRSDAVNLATGFFQQLLRQDRRKRRGRRRLVNLILDPAYPLSDEEKQTLYIMAPGKSRALWLEELAVSVGAATLTQQLSRRALFGMGAGAAVAVASAGVAGTVLVRQFRSQQDPLLPVQGKISGNPRFTFTLSDTKAAYDSSAVVFQDGATVYAQPSLKYDTSIDTPTAPDSSVYVLTASDKKQRRIPIASQPPASAFSPVQGKVVTYDPVQSVLVAAAHGVLALYSEPSPLFIPTETSVLSLVSAHDGQQRWKVTCALAGTPALSDEAVFCVLQDQTKIEGGSVYYESSLNAFSMRDGSRLWRTTDYSFDTILTPAVAGGRLYIGSYLDQDHNLYCFDAKTGKKLWSYLTRGAVLCTPTIANGIVYVGSQDNFLYALDAKTGALSWRFANSESFHAAPLVRDGVVYAPSLDGYVYALDARSGAMFWRAYVGINPKTDDMALRALDSNPVMVYRNVLFAITNGALYAFDTRDGSQRWRYIPVAEDLHAVSLPVMSSGLVLVGAADNRVYAVNP